MPARYDDKRIYIFDSNVEFDPYYFAIASENGDVGYHGFMKRVFHQWAQALIETEGETLYFPFGIYDQCVECFNVTVIDERVVLKRVWFLIEGYTLNLQNLRDFIRGDHKIGASSPVFGEYDRTDLIKALVQAEPIAE